jgi:hypothetical protein
MLPLATADVTAASLSMLAVRCRADLLKCYDEDRAHNQAVVLVARRHPAGWQ